MLLKLNRTLGAFDYTLKKIIKTKKFRKFIISINKN